MVNKCDSSVIVVKNNQLVSPPEKRLPGHKTVSSSPENKNIGINTIKKGIF